MTNTVWAPDGGNLVVHADNAEYLPTLPDGAFTLIYVDPPFNTGRAQTPAGNPHGAQRRTAAATAWASRAAPTTPSRAPCTATTTPSATTGPSWNRGCVEAWRLLADDGTLYLHLDYREVHYAKVMLDAIFGRECFLNEIIWAYDYGARAKNRWPTKHDNILVYVKNPVQVPLRQRRGGPGAVHGARAWSRRPSASWANCPRTSGGTPSSRPPARRRPATPRRSPRA